MKPYKRSKYKIMARYIAHEAIRNNTSLEWIHCKGGISDKEMRTLMLEIEENLRICLWFWDRKRKDVRLLKTIEKLFFDNGGVTWDRNAKEYKTLSQQSKSKAIPEYAKT